MRTLFSQLARPAAALAVAAATLGAAAGPSAAEGPCGTPYFSGDSTRIGNMVWLDDDNDGAFEPAAGEAPLSGVTLELWLDSDFDGVFEPTGDDAGTALCTTTTNVDGHYWFTDVASGKYFIAVTGGVPDGLVSSTGIDSTLTTDHSDNGDPSNGYLSVSDAITVAINDDQPLLETAPAGAPGSDEAIADAANGPTSDNNSNLTIDFGFTTAQPTCVSIGNRVFIDENNNGVDDGEAPMANVVLELVPVDADGAPTGPAIASVRSNGNGYYQFSCVDPGRYIVRIPASQFAADGPLAGMESAIDLDDAGTIDLADDGVAQGDDIVSAPIDMTIGGAPAGETDKPADVGVDFDAPADDSSDTTVDFGFVPTTVVPPTVASASLGDKVWLDADGNGVQDADEAGVAGVTVNLRDADGNVIATTTTDTDGMYGFTDLEAGDYQVCFDLDTIPADHEATTANAGGNEGAADAADSDADPTTGCTPVVTLTDGENNPTIDLGLVPTTPTPPVEPGPTASLGDKVWIDANANGIQDADEVGVPNVTVNLRDAAGDTIASTTTDADGMYGFTDLAPGDYRVCFDLGTLPTGMIVTNNDAAGSVDTNDSDALAATGCTPVTTLDAGENDPTIDLGIRQAAADLSIAKVGALRGSDAVWTITVTNVAGDSSGSITVSDTLPTTLDFVSATSASFNCTAAGRALTCTSTNELAAGESATITVVTKPSSRSTCSASNTATVSAAAADSVTANNSATGSVTLNCVVTRGALPRTGAGVGMLLGLATLLGLGGWFFTSYARRERPVAIENRID